MLTGITQKETIHGNPGESRKLPAGILVELRRATNLPTTNSVKFWAHPLPEHPWPKLTAVWAEDVGVGLEETDVEFVTPMTANLVDNLADIRLIQEHGTGDFVRSICDQFTRRGLLSPRQWAAVNRMANDIRNPKSKLVLDFAAIVAIFTAAAAHLKYPKVRLALPDCSICNGNGTSTDFDASLNGPIGETVEQPCQACNGNSEASEIVLSRAGDRARQPGTINVTNGGRYGEPDNKWYGRIGLDGTFQRAHDCTDEIAALLVAFSADPAGVAMAHGKMTGNCCFCGRKLSDERSTEMGYGPTCAKNFGLIWGVKNDKAVA